MSTVEIPVTVGLNTFIVVNGSTVRYNGTDYTGVTDIQYPDGTHKTCQDIIDAAGGTTFQAGELKACVKVQGINPDDNNREIFSLYSNNSHSTAKNNSAGVPGTQMSVEMFSFMGDDTNYIVKMWHDAFPAGTPDQFVPTWLGFRINFGVIETRAYTYTQLNSMLEESVPCPPAIIDVTYMHGVKVSGIFQQPAPVIGFNQYGVPGPPDYYVPIASMRLYRSQTTSDGSFVFRLVQRQPHSPIAVDPFPTSTAYGANFWIPTYPFTFTDDVRSEDLSTIFLPSIDWDAPPLGLKGLQLLPNGSMAAFKDNHIYLSEPFRPHAWPAKYIQTVGFEITALEQDGMGLVALTTGFAYMLLGAHPSVIVPQRLDQTQSAKQAGILNGIRGPSHSVCKTPVGLVYATDEGLMREYGGQTQMITAGLMTKAEWQERFQFYFGSLWLAYSNGKILGYTSGGNVRQSFLMALDGSWLTHFTTLAPDEVIYTHFSLPGSDGLYVITGEGNAGDPSNLQKFEQFSGGTMACTWESKKMIMVRPYNFGCYQIAGSGHVSVIILAGGVTILFDPLVLTDQVSQIRRLPICQRERMWQIILLVGKNSHVSEFYMANTQLELQNV